ncbi:MAG TPA: endonuclease/exonuclease/phosphatase family protein [Acidimicrobiales bacterium]|nr:endonuclease/exonuclease/phosphatase family protein [Acidimicrobiales bacterium]
MRPLQPSLRRPARSLIIGVLVAALTVTACSSGDSDGGADGAAVGSAATATTATSASADWDGEISALTYNVAGLPEALSGSDPEVNTAQIGPKLNAFDLVLLQETWKTPEPNPLAPTRVYYEILEKASTHSYQAPMPDQPLGADPDRPSALLADGLGFLSNFPLGEVTHVPWEGCFGGADTSDHGAADCLAFKGFAVTTITPADGVTIDVYNLHGEAGSSDKDQPLQADDYTQLAAYIAEHSKGHAIILGGDTNLHIEDDPENPQDVADAKIWADFLEATGLADSCDPADCDDTARIDKFAYRNGGDVEVGVVDRKVETKRFTDDAGEQLSDHEAVAVTFGWRKAG